MRVEITKKHTKMEGTTHDLLIGLACYIDALKANGIPEPLIKHYIDFAFEEDDFVIRDAKKEEKKDTISELLKALGLEG
jgi:hypothetical protein